MVFGGSKNAIILQLAMMASWTGVAKEATRMGAFPSRLKLAMMASLIFLAMGELLSWPPSVQAAAPPEKARVEIDRIEIVGVSVFDQATLESALEIGAGEVLERIKVKRTQENLEGLYQVRGYEEVNVKSEFIRRRTEEGAVENVIQFTVAEGRPIRIASIQLVPQSVRKEMIQKYWLKMEEKLASRVGLLPGHVFDQDKVAAGKRAVQDFLASEEFVGARVNDVRIQTASAMPGVPSLASLPAARWVDLELQVELGDRITFGFRGNTLFNRGRLDSLIEEQRVIGFGQDYVSSIANRIEEEYRAAGHGHVEVVSYTFERPERQERHITYEIKEGAKTFIESIDFDGEVVFSKDELTDEFFHLAPPFVQRRNYVEKEVAKTAELLIEWIKSQGYLAAKLITVSRIFNPKKNAFKLVIYLYEGDQTTVQNIRLAGVTGFTEEEVFSILGTRKRYPLNIFSLNEGIETLKATYRAKGYLGMSLLNEDKETVVQYTNENRSASVLLEVDEGPLYRVSRIVLEGLSKTREEVVWRELALSLKEGDVLEEQKILETEGRLRRLGIFSVVSVRPEEDATRPGHKVVSILLQEGTPGLIAGGIGYRNDLGFRLFGQTAYTNLWRRNHSLLFNANLNRRFDERFCANEDEFGVRHGGPCFLEYAAEVGYIWPWFLLDEATFRPKLTVEETQYRGLDAFTISLSSTLERRVLRSVPLVGALTYSLERTEQYNAQFDINNQKHVIGALIPSLRLDLRNNSLAPTSGVFSVLSYEVSSPSLLSQGDPYPIAYTRFQWRTDGFVPLGKGITWFLSFRTGYERNLVATPPTISDADIEARRFAIPLIKQFALGGAGSVRGFEEQKINRNDLAIRGTLSYVNYRMQLDFPFAGALRFGPFLDAANLLDNRFSFGMLRYGTGFGFHYLSPVGPINFDLGFNLFPKGNESPSQFHFSIGVI